MENEKVKNVIIVLLVAIVAILSTILGLVLTDNLSFKEEVANPNLENNETAEKKDLLTEDEALQLGKDLYKYANSVGSCQEFEYLHNQPSGSIVLNYEEVASKFTQNYINNGTSTFENVFRSISRGEDGKYYDSSVCGFGLSCAKNLLTEFKIINIAESHITFEVTVSTIATGCDQEVGTVVRTDTQTFALKKENDIWKIDVYVFKYVTEW